MIPSNRLWKVTLRYADGPPQIWTGYAPNKMFAKWNARDALGHMAFWNAVKVTIGMCRKERGALSQ